MCVFHACSSDFEEAERRPADYRNRDTGIRYDEMLRSLCSLASESERFRPALFAVLHHLCRARGTPQNHGALLGYLLEDVGSPAMPTLNDHGMATR